MQNYKIYKNVTDISITYIFSNDTKNTSRYICTMHQNNALIRKLYPKEKRCQHTGTLGTLNSNNSLG